MRKWLSDIHKLV